MISNTLSQIKLTHFQLRRCSIKIFIALFDEKKEKIHALSLISRGPNFHCIVKVKLSNINMGFISADINEVVSSE